jgi:hypothetical protein
MLDYDWKQALPELCNLGQGTIMAIGQLLYCQGKGGYEYQITRASH